MTTQWNLVFQAHQGTPDEVAAAQTALMMRYGGAIHRYLLAVTRDPDAADELDQEFAVRFLRGDFHRADPSRGRFRDFLKQSIRNLIIDHRRRQSRRPHALADEASLPDHGGPAIDDLDRQFLKSWRDELLARAWAALAELERRTGQPHHTILRFRTDNPTMPSHEAAAAFNARLGKTFTPAWFRQALRRSREHFVGFLLDEIAASMHGPTPDQLEEEVIELGLHDYCAAALRRRNQHR